MFETYSGARGLAGGCSPQYWEPQYTVSNVSAVCAGHPGERVLKKEGPDAWTGPFLGPPSSNHACAEGYAPPPPPPGRNQLNPHPPGGACLPCSPPDRTLDFAPPSEFCRPLCTFASNSCTSAPNSCTASTVRRPDVTKGLALHGPVEDARHIWMQPQNPNPEALLRFKVCVHSSRGRPTLPVSPTWPG